MSKHYGQNGQHKSLHKLDHYLVCGLKSASHRLFILTYVSGRSQNKGKQAIEAILALQKTVEEYNKEVADLEQKLMTLDFDMRVETAADISARLQGARKKRSSVEAAVRAKTLALEADWR